MNEWIKEPVEFVVLWIMSPYFCKLRDRYTNLTSAEIPDESVTSQWNRTFHKQVKVTLYRSFRQIHQSMFVLWVSDCCLDLQFFISTLDLYNNVLLVIIIKSDVYFHLGPHNPRHLSPLEYLFAILVFPHLKIDNFQAPNKY